MPNGSTSDLPKATWNSVTVVESDDIAHVEGNAYFKITDVNSDILTESSVTKPTYCHWKGMAYYYDLKVRGKINVGAAWHYPAPYPQANIISNRIAFWKGVEVQDLPKGRGLVEGKPCLGDKVGWEALCWLIKFSDKAIIPMEEVTKITKIKADEIESFWNNYDVKRYAARYGRLLSLDPKKGWSLVADKCFRK